MEPMLTVALNAARKAGEKLERAFERIDTIKIEEKARNDFVSDADRQSESEILYHLQKAYPDHRFIGEEGGISGPDNAEYEWIIDPLDGTTNFLHGIPHFAISIACRKRGQLEHAIVLDPIKREEFTATRGRGALLNGRRIRISARPNFEGALIATGIPFNGFALQHIDAFVDCMKEIAAQSSGIRRPGAAALDLAYVAAGRFDGFWEMNLKPWDIAAGMLLIKEAGGMTSDFRGGNSMLDSGNIVSATPKIFKPLLQVVERHMGHIKA